MVYRWEPWTQYDTGAVVEYEGSLWKVIQGHQSEPNWQPPNVPALFSRLPEEEHDDYRSGRRHHGVEEHHRGDEGRCGGGRPQPGGWGHEEHRGDRLEHHRNEQGGQYGQNEQGWLTEKRKHELEIGGGIAAAALAIGGGVYAYEAHKNKASEEAKKQAWQSQANEQTWHQGAVQRTQHYENGGQAPPVRWVLLEVGQPFPQDAIVGGREHGHPLYIARAFYEGGLHVGKAAPQLNDGRGGCSIAYGGKEIMHLNKFEVLVGDDRAIKWVNHTTHQGPVVVQGYQPVEGGREGRDGRFIFVVQVRHDNGVHPGKYSEGEPHACFSYGGKELTTREFNILAYDLPAVRWVKASAGQPLPPDAIIAGRENTDQNEPLFICRASYRGGLHVGKAGDHLNDDAGGCSIPFGGHEIRDIHDFEVLVGDPSALRWRYIDLSDGARAPNINELKSVEAGHEMDGRQILVAQARIEGGIHPAKWTVGEAHACVSFGGYEHRVTDFNVLSYA